MNNDGRQELPNEQQDKIFTRRFISIALVNFAVFFSFNLTTTSIPIFVASTGASALIAGLSTTLVTVTSLIIRTFGGIIIGHYGKKIPLIASIVIMSICIIAYAVLPIVGVILIWRLIHGIGWGLSTTCSSTIVADITPRKRFAEGIGYFSLSVSLAMAIAPALAVAMLENVGFKPVLIVAIIASSIALLLSFFQKNDTIFQKNETVVRTEEKKKLVVSDFIDKRALLPSGVMFLISCSFASVGTFIAIHAKEVGVEDVYVYFIVYSVANIVTRPVIGRVIDRIGFFLPCILASISLMVSLAMISLSSSLIIFCIGGFFGGLGLGTNMGALQTMSVASVPPERRAVATSTFLIALDGGYGIGALLGGIIATAIGFSKMYLVVSLLALAAALIFVFMGKKRVDSY